LGRAGADPGEDGAMRRTIGFVALWFVAGAAAATVAWLGVSTVSDQLAGSGSHPDPLSADQISDELAAGPGDTTTTVQPESTTTTVLPSTTTTTAAPPPGGSTTTSTTGSVAPPPPTATAQPPAAQPVTKSYDLEGGTATLRFTPTGVTVVVATPAPGFTVKISDSHSNGKRVEFESDDHRSRLDAWWDGGPQDEVREDD
jgi:hypothetical protein